jgi:hypothetical protein
MVVTFACEYSQKQKYYQNFVDKKCVISYYADDAGNPFLRKFDNSRAPSLVLINNGNYLFISQAELFNINGVEKKAKAKIRDFLK